MTTTITVQGISYTIPNDKVHDIVSMLKAYEALHNAQKHQQVKEVLTNNPNSDGRMLING